MVECGDDYKEIAKARASCTPHQVGVNGALNRNPGNGIGESRFVMLITGRFSQLALAALRRSSVVHSKSAESMLCGKRQLKSETSASDACVVGLY